MLYDIAIVGGGPAGLTLAHACAVALRLKVVLLERDSVFGGCHRVRRVGPDGIFTEHGPREYFRAFVSFDRALRRAGIDGGMRTHFAPYKGSSGTTGPLLPSFADTCKLVNAFAGFLVSGRTFPGTVAEWLKQANASPQTFQSLDALCARVDGARADRFSFEEFMQLGNQMAFHSTMLQPTHATDRGGFVEAWTNAVRAAGVDMRHSIRVKAITPTGCPAGAYALRTDVGDTIIAQRVVFALPPEALARIRGARDAFPDIDAFARRTAYDHYITVTFEFRPTTRRRTISELDTAWGVLALETSATTANAGRTPDAVVVSAAVSRLNRASPFTGRTANETDDAAAFVREALRQFYEISDGFGTDGATAPIAVTATLGPFAKHVNGRWTDIDYAYVRVPGTRPLAPHSTGMPGVYSVGAHNGRSLYAFTSIEAAVANADALLFEWTRSTEFAPVQALTLRQALAAFWLCLMTVLPLLWYR